MVPLLLLFDWWFYVREQESHMESFEQDAQRRDSEHKNVEPKLALSVKEAARASSLSRAFIYAEWQSGRGPARIKAGNRTLILADALWEWLRSLEAKPDKIASTTSVSVAASPPKLVATAPCPGKSPARAIALSNAVTLERHGARSRTEGRVPFLQRLTCTINDACAATGLGRTKLYEFIGEGLIETTRAGRRRLIIVSSLSKCFPAK